MTLDGTNTYVVAEPGHGGCVIVDPGPADRAHLDRLLRIVAERDVEVDLVAVTHHHDDHAGGAAAAARRFGSPVAAPDPSRVAGATTVLSEGLLHVAGLRLEVVPTPGHTSDHRCIRLPDGALLTGDHILGRGTTVVAHPDGDLGSYLRSLERVAATARRALYPGHGPVLLDDPAAVVAYYLEHRRFRIGQVEHAIRGGAATVDEVVDRVYTGLAPALRAAARASTRAAVDLLLEEGRVEVRHHRLVAGDA